MRIPGLILPTLIRLAGLVSLISVATSLASCSTAGDTPLGGPMGGTATVPPPTDGGNDAGPLIATATTVTTVSGSTVTMSTSTRTMTTATTTISTGPPAPTWTALWTKYLSVPHTGCVNNGCHTHDLSESPAANCSTPKACFTWIGGGSGFQVSAAGGLFVWDSGGFMPKAQANPPNSDPQADMDFAAWIAAGAQDN